MWKSKMKTFLRNCGLNEAIYTFSKHCIKTSQLTNLTERELEQLLPKIGDRHIFKTAIKRKRTEENRKRIKRANSGWTVLNLADVGMVKGQKKRMQASGRKPEHQIKKKTSIMSRPKIKIAEILKSDETATFNLIQMAESLLKSHSESLSAENLRDAMPGWQLIDYEAGKLNCPLCPSQILPFLRDVSPIKWKITNFNRHLNDFHKDMQDDCSMYSEIGNMVNVVMDVADSSDDGDFTGSDNQPINILISAKLNEPLVEQALPKEFLPFVALRKELFLKEALRAEQPKEPENPTCDGQLSDQLTYKVPFPAVHLSKELLMNGFCSNDPQQTNTQSSKDKSLDESLPLQPRSDKASVDPQQTNTNYPENQSSKEKSLDESLPEEPETDKASVDPQQTNKNYPENQSSEDKPLDKSLLEEPQTDKASVDPQQTRTHYPEEQLSEDKSLDESVPEEPQSDTASVDPQQTRTHYPEEQSSENKSLDVSLSEVPQTNKESVDEILPVEPMPQQPLSAGTLSIDTLPDFCPNQQFPNQPLPNQTWPNQTWTNATWSNEHRLYQHMGSQLWANEEWSNQRPSNELWPIQNRPNEPWVNKLASNQTWPNQIWQNSPNVQWPNQYRQNVPSPNDHRPTELWSNQFRPYEQWSNQMSPNEDQNKSCTIQPPQNRALEIQPLQKGSLEIKPSQNQRLPIKPHQNTPQIQPVQNQLTQNQPLENQQRSIQPLQNQQLQPPQIKMSLNVGLREDVLRCICGLFRDNDAVKIQCSKCSVWQHTECTRADEKFIDYLCEKCDHRPVDLEIPLNTYTDEGDQQYLSLMRGDQQVRVTDTVYILRDIPILVDSNSESTSLPKKHTYKTIGPIEFTECDIFRVEQLWKDKDGNRHAFGHHYLRPHETYRAPSQKFYRNELVRVPLYENVSLDLVTGRCWVMDPKTFCKGRPIDCDDESHVYVCQFRVDKAARQFFKMTKQQYPICTKSFAFRKFGKNLKISRNYLPLDIDNGKTKK